MGFGSTQPTVSLVPKRRSVHASRSSSAAYPVYRGVLSCGNSRCVASSRITKFTWRKRDERVCTRSLAELSCLFGENQGQTRARDSNVCGRIPRESRTVSFGGQNGGSALVVMGHVRTGLGVVVGREQRRPHPDRLPHTPLARRFGDWERPRGGRHFPQRRRSRSGNAAAIRSRAPNESRRPSDVVVCAHFGAGFGV